LSDAGYGETNYKSDKVSVHRLLYAWLVEPVPCGRGRHIPHLDHLICSNRKCGNPAHLKLVTPKENILRGSGPCAVNARKTHCKRGHPLPTDSNERHCWPCHQMKSAEYYQENREAIIARTNRSRQIRENGPRREELLAIKRERYHRDKILRRRPS
jgi:hypothetical protein